MYAAFVLLPFIFRVACIYLFERRGWTRRIAALLIAAVGFSVSGEERGRPAPRWPLAPLTFALFDLPTASRVARETRSA